ncbi:MAG: DUF4012 domain-containing protein [Microbacteriaceae bacterium]|nr:DUF4012 domain-containing protein [Microbacteriaceae bacterium]
MSARHGTHAQAGAHPWLRPRWIVLAGILLLLILVIGWAVATLQTAVKAKTMATRAQTELTTAVKQYQAGNATAAQSSFQRARAQIHSAATATDALTWRAAQYLPFVGSDVRAARITLTQADHLMVAAGPFARTLFKIDPDRLVSDGGVDVASLTGLAKETAPLSASVQKASTRLGTIDDSKLVPQLRTPLKQFKSALSTAAPLLRTGAALAPHLPKLLGAEGSQNYLMVFQNNAETRALGGNPASLLLLNVTDGKLTVARQAGSQDFTRDTEVAPLTPDVFTVFPYNINHYEMDMTGYPDLPTVATLAKAWWAQRYPDHIDGVLTFDPVGLSALLGATGPVTLPNGDVLTQNNVVKTVLSDVYARYPDPDVQNAYFAAAAAAVFEALTTKPIQPQPLATALGTALNQNRLHLWSATPAIQALIAQDSRLAGTIPADTAHHKSIGTYLWDTTGSKIDYHVTSASKATASVCRTKGTITYTVDVTLTSTITPEQAQQLPSYVLPDVPKAARHFTTDIYAFGPAKSTFTGMSVLHPGKSQSLQQQGSTLGRPAARAALEMNFGTSATLRFTFVAHTKTSLRGLTIQTNPLVSPVQTTTKVENRCQ